MIYEHYGFPSLERWPNTFFKEQLAHLEIAVDKALKPVNKRVHIPVRRIPENNTRIRQIEVMKKEGWITSGEIARLVGIGAKLASANIFSLRLQGHDIKMRKCGPKPEYLLTAD